MKKYSTKYLNQIEKVMRNLAEQSSGSCKHLEIWVHAPDRYRWSVWLNGEYCHFYSLEELQRALENS